MSVIEEIKIMRQSGKSEPEIMRELQQRGLSRQEIINVISQTKIKEAVNLPPADFESNMSQEFENMPPGLSAQQEQIPLPLTPPTPVPSELQDQTAQTQTYSQSPQQYPQEIYSQEAYPQPPQTYDYDYNNQQYPASQSISADTISEIAEQIVTERLAKIRNQLEKITDLKTMAETKVAHIDERLQRIEKIIDRLQLSILQKIGEYTSDVSDLKKELVETQKSFKTLTPKSRRTHSYSHHKTQKHKHPA